jgi:tRNA-2-methylthio-N6-dimethylallyladenosine synthase
LRQPQRQRPADHTAADDGDSGLLDSHGQLSLLENTLSLPDFFTLRPTTFILVTTEPKHYNTRPAILSMSMSMTKKLHIKTWGCQMNEYDSSKMADLLDATHGYQLTENAKEADVLLLNTCSIREKAQEKVFHLLGRWKLLKRKNPELIIGVGGCVASQEGKLIRQRAPYVDIVFGPQTLHRLPEMINKVRG